MSDEDLRGAWERGKPVEADRTRRSSTSVVSLRLQDDTMRALAERARNEDKAIGTLGRELLEAALADEAPTTPQSLASMFERWIGEALNPASTPTLGSFMTSRPIAAKCWFSFDTVSRRNVHFAEAPSVFFGISKPIVTSRTVEPETDSAGKAA